MTQELPEQPGRVPVGELRELVEEWRDYRDEAVNDELDGYAGGHTECIKDLEAVIERYE